MTIQSWLETARELRESGAKYDEADEVRFIMQSEQLANSVYYAWSLRRENPGMSERDFQARMCWWLNDEYLKNTCQQNGIPIPEWLI